MIDGSLASSREELSGNDNCYNTLSEQFRGEILRCSIRNMRILPERLATKLEGHG